MVYTIEERQDIVEIYIHANKNKRIARNEYIRKYPGRFTPSENTFTNVFKNFRDKSSLHIPKRVKVKPVLTEETEFNTLLYFEENPRHSINQAANHLDLPRTDIWRIMNNNKRKPFKIWTVQGLRHDDYALRRDFCREMMNRNRADPNFLRNICFTDESSFSTAGMFNRRNEHFWATENPHFIHPLKQQGRQTVNVWCGIHRNKIIGPVFIEGQLTGDRYLNLLRQEIGDLLDDIPLQQRHQMIWQHDGAPQHYTLAVRNFLNRNYNVWIGRGGPVTWPPRSPDLTPLDFYLWGALKNKIYKDQIGNVNMLKNRIREEINFLNNDPHVFEQIRLNFIRRCQLCIHNNGGHFENVI